MIARSRPLIVTAVLAAFALVSSACADGDGVGPTPGATSPGATTPGDEAATETVTQTETETETETEAATASPTEPGPIGATQQTFILGPQQPVTTLTSDRDEREGRGEVEFQVVGRYDEGPLPDTLWLGWVPCEDADPTTDPITFADEDDDGTADITGEPDILLRTVNGEPYENVDQVWPTQVQVQGDELSFTLDSYDPACAVPVVFADENGNAELDLADDGTPTEPFGVAKVTWEAGS